MNKEKILETARRIREKDLPFEFSMAHCSTCIMEVVSPGTSYTKGAEVLGISDAKAYDLFFAYGWFGLLSSITNQEAAGVLECLAATGEVDWTWSKENAV